MTTPTGRLPRETNPVPGERAGFLPTHKSRTDDTYHVTTGQGGGLDANVLTSALPTGASTAANQTALMALVDELEARVGNTTDAAATGNGSVNAILKRLREQLDTQIANQATIAAHVDTLEARLGDTTDAEATGNGSVNAILKRIRTLMGSVSIASSALPTGASTAANQTTIIGHIDGVESSLTTLIGHVDTVEARIGDTTDAEASGNGSINAIMKRIRRDVGGVRNWLGTRAIFGARWDKGSGPTLTRTGEAVGMVANAGVDFNVVVNDFDSAPIWGEFQEVMDTLGNVFIRIPKFYIRKLDGAAFKSWEVSKHQHPGFYLPWCFWDFANGRELPHVDVGKYKGSSEVIGATNRLRSVPNVAPLIFTNIVDFRTIARNNNVLPLAGYQQLDIHVVDLLQTLFYIEFATLHSQSIMSGFSTGQYSSAHTATVAETAVNRIIVANAHADLFRMGQTISVGTTLGGNQIFYGRTITAITTFDASNRAISFDGAPVNIAVGNIVYNTAFRNGSSLSGLAASSGSRVSNSDGRQAMVYRGIESLYGDGWQFVDGVNINERQAWVAQDAGVYASNVFAAPYRQLGYVNSATDGWVTAMGHDPFNPFAELPVAVGGGSATFYSDHHWQAAGQRIALFGGSWSLGSDVGVSAWRLDHSSASAAVGVGGRLVRKAL